MISVFKNMTAPYSRLEAWGYDRFIAPAVAEYFGVANAMLGQLDAGATVLEVGCGGGQLAITMCRQRPDLHWTGLDLSAAQVARARGRAAELNRLRFVEGSALELPFDDGSFDAVLSVASIKHWPDPARGLRECVRVLRAGGQLGVVEADRGCRLADARAFVERWRLPRFTRPANLLMFRTLVAGSAFDLDDARALLEPLGLEDAEVARLAGTPAWLMRGQRA